jgi:hypothetical protein
MRMKPAVLLATLATTLVASAPAAAAPTVRLRIGEAVDVLGTRIACFAVKSSGKVGIACVLLGPKQPVAGSVGVGLAADGTAVLTRIRSDGSGAPILRRKSEMARVHRLGVGRTFAIPVTATVDLGCKVINVTDTSLAPLYRGVKVSCWRADTGPLPSSYGVSISDRMAGIFRFDAQGRVSAEGVVRRQPPAKAEG